MGLSRLWSWMPAFDTTMSKRPNALTVSATARPASASLETSPAMGMARPFASSTWRAVRSTVAAVRPITPIAAPSAAMRRAVAAPMPLPAPVMRATLFANRIRLLRVDRLLGLLDLAHTLDRVRQHLGILVPELLELRRVQVGDGRLHLIHGRLEVSVLHGGAHRVAELLHDRLRRPFGGKHPRPDVKLRVVAKLFQRGELREHRNPLFPPAGQGAELPGFDVGQHHRRSRGHAIDVATEQGS